MQVRRTVAAEQHLVCPRCRMPFVFRYLVEGDEHPVPGWASCPRSFCREPVRTRLPWNAYDRWSEPLAGERAQGMA